MKKIDEDHLKNVCKIGCAGCCAYLVCGAGGFECAKEDLGLKAGIDARLAQGTMRATGDNCDGPEIAN